MLSKMEDYNDYIIAKREYEVFPDGGYTIIKAEPCEHHLVRMIAEEGGVVSTDYLCYLSGSSHRIPLFREKQLAPSIEMGYVTTIEENGKEYCILTEKGTELYKAISTQETAGSTQETAGSTQETAGSTQETHRQMKDAIGIKHR